MKEYVVTVDIAKKRDFFAVMIFRKFVELVEGAKRIRAADRFVNYLYIVSIDKLQNLTYPEMARFIAAWMGHSALVHNADLLVDGTGVGEGAIDCIREEGLDPVPIIFTPGGQVREVYTDFGEVFRGSGGKLAPIKTLKEIHVPKEDLKAAGQLLAQQDRVRTAPGVAWLDDFEAQFMGFKGKVNENTGHRKYEAESEELHDDLVVCYLMGAWWMLREGLESIPDQVVNKDRTIKERLNGYDPYDYM